MAGNDACNALCYRSNSEIRTTNLSWKMKRDNQLTVRAGILLIHSGSISNGTI